MGTWDRQSQWCNRLSKVRADLVAGFRFVGGAWGIVSGAGATHLGGLLKDKKKKEEATLMRRILSVLSVAVLMAAMVAASAVTALPTTMN